MTTTQDTAMTIDELFLNMGLELKHHGVKGMRWGVHRFPDKAQREKNREFNRVNAAKGNPRKTAALEKRNAKKSASSQKNPVTVKDPRKLSDADLRSAVARMQLERQFSQLQAETRNSSRGKRGSDFAKEFMISQGKKQARRVADKAIDMAVEAAIKGAATKTNNPALGELAKRMKPKKK